MASGNFRHRGACLVLLSGLPGTGKTTFARALSARIPLEHLESDAIRRALATLPRYTPAENARVFSEVERRAAAALGVGSHALVDATNLTPGDRRRFFSLAERLSAPVVAIRLTAPPATVRQRLRGAREGSSEAGFAVYEGMRARARPFAGRSVVVDTRYPLGPPLRLVAALLGESSP